MKKQLYEISKSATTIDPVSQDELENGVEPTQEETAGRMNLFLNYSSKQLFSISKELQNFIEAQGLTLNELDNTQLEQAITKSILNLAFPIGSIYQSTVNTSPASFLGGTWAVFGTGRVLVGVDTSQTEFDTVEKTGGEKTHLLTSAESGLPSHNHNLSPTAAQYYGVGDAAAGGVLPRAQGAEVSSTQNNTAANASSAHNNLQPYITVYMWKRTA